MDLWVYEEFYYGSGMYPTGMTYRHRGLLYQYRASTPCSTVEEARALAEKYKLKEPYLLRWTDYVAGGDDVICLVVGWIECDKESYVDEVRNRNSYRWELESLEKRNTYYRREPLVLSEK